MIHDNDTRFRLPPSNSARKRRRPISSRTNGNSRLIAACGLYGNMLTYTSWYLAMSIAFASPCLYAGAAGVEARDSRWTRRSAVTVQKPRSRWFGREKTMVQAVSRDCGADVARKMPRSTAAVRWAAGRRNTFTETSNRLGHGAGCMGKYGAVEHSSSLFCRGGADFDDNDEDSVYDDTTDNMEEQDEDTGSDSDSDSGEELGLEGSMSESGSDSMDVDRRDRGGVDRTFTEEDSEEEQDSYDDDEYDSTSDSEQDSESEEVREGSEEEVSTESMSQQANDSTISDDNADADSIQVCVMTWNLAEASPPAGDLAFLRKAAERCDIVAVGVQEIENLKPRRNEGGRTREWRRLLLRTLGRDFVRVGHQAMGGVQLTLFARRELVERVKVIKLTEVACGVGNVLQNKGGIGAFVRVDRTTFLFIAAHLAAHQGKQEERNAGYWRIVNTLGQEIPPAWITHAARKRVKRLKASSAAAAAAALAASQSLSHDVSSAGSGLEMEGRGDGGSGTVRGDAQDLTFGRGPFRGPFQDRVDRVFFFGDLNYRVDLCREDLELGISVARQRQEEGDAGRRRGMRRERRGFLYPGTSALDALLDFDQLTLMRSQGKAFGGFSEGRVSFEPTYKYDKGSQELDTSRKMRPPAWTDRILFSPGGPSGVSPLEYRSVPDSSHSDHRPVYATFRIRLDR